MDQRSKNVKFHSAILFVSFYAAWVGSILASFSEHSTLFAIGATAPMLFIFHWVNKSRSIPMKHWLSGALLTTLLGIFVDSILLSFNFIELSPGQSYLLHEKVKLIPFWYWMVWLSFTLSLADWTQWKAPIWLCALLGSVGGPASFIAAEKMGAIKLNIGWIPLGILWFFLFPVLMKIQSHFQDRNNPKI